MPASAKPPAPKQPTPASLAKSLGAAHAHWSTLLETAAELAPDAKGEWKLYSGKTWTYVLKGKKRNLMYLSPRDGEFLASFALGEQAVAALPESGLPAALIAEIQQAPKYPEGRPARVTVTTAADTKTVLTLLKLKLTQ